jgi:nucleoside-diphosphate-sugar epimerase
MRVFVAGATGVIGRALVPRLIGAGHEVTGMFNDQRGKDSLRTLGAKAVQLDVFDRAGLAAALLSERPDAVIDQLTSLGKADFAANNRLRVEGTRNLVDAAKGADVSRFVAQSYCLYAPGAGFASEDDPLDLESDAWSRSITGVVALERMVNEMPDGVILRYGTLYGPGTWYALDGMVADKLLKGEFVATDDVTSFVHADDAAQSAMLALEWPKGTYNIVDDEPAPMTEWATFLAVLLSAPTPRMASTPQEKRQRGVSNAKARGEVGWQPIHPSWREAFRSEYASAETLI